MSLQLELIRTRNTFEAILMGVISLILSLISIALIVALLSTFKDPEGVPYLAIDYDELYNFAIRDVVSKPENIAGIFFWKK